MLQLTINTNTRGGHSLSTIKDGRENLSISHIKTLDNVVNYAKTAVANNFGNVRYNLYGTERHLSVEDIHGKLFKGYLIRCYNSRNLKAGEAA